MWRALSQWAPVFARCSLAAATCACSSAAEPALLHAADHLKTWPEHKVQKVLDAVLQAGWASKPAASVVEACFAAHGHAVLQEGSRMAELARHTRE